jgi:transposase
MRIVRPVRVKFVVTQELKDALVAQSRQALTSLDSRVQQIEVEGRRVIEHIQRENVLRAGQVREQLEEEKQNLLELRREMSERAREVEGLQLGDEITQRMEFPLQEIVDIEVGDGAAKVLGLTEVLIKDDRITEIREVKVAPEAEAAAEGVPIPAEGAEG